MPKSTFFNLPDDKRQRIIDLALEEFAAAAYHQASLSRIVDRAGIAKGSIYQYFEDKFDLYLYLLGLVVDIKLRYVREALAELPQDAGLFDRLTAATAGGLRMVQDHPQLQRLGDRMMSEPDEFLLEVASRFGQAKDTTMDSWVRDAAASGELDPRVPPGLAAYVIQTIFMGMGRDMAAGRVPREHMLGLVRQVFDILAHGMMAKDKGLPAATAPGAPSPSAQVKEDGSR